MKQKLARHGGVGKETGSVRISRNLTVIDNQDREYKNDTGGLIVRIAMALEPLMRDIAVVSVIATVNAKVYFALAFAS